MMTLSLKAVAIILIILPFAVIFPVGFYMERSLPYTNDDYCDLCNDQSEWIIFQEDDGTTYPTHEFCGRDAYIYFFSVTLIMDLLHLNLTIPDYALAQTHFFQISVFLIYYCSVTFYLMSIRRKNRKPTQIQPKIIQWEKPATYVRTTEAVPHKMKLKDAILNAFEEEGDSLTMKQIVAYIDKHRDEIEDLPTINYEMRNGQALRDIINDLKETGKIKKDAGGEFLETEGLDTYSRVRAEETSQGLPLPPPPPPPEREGSIIGIAATGAFVVVFILILFVLPVFPVAYETTEMSDRTQILLDEVVNVPFGECRIIYVSIDANSSEKQSCRVYGNIRETSGQDINFYVLNRENFDLWEEGKGGSAWAYVSLLRTQSRDFLFLPDYRGVYIFVFDNYYSHDNKVTYINATFSWIEYMPVMKAKYKSLIEILLASQGETP